MNAQPRQRREPRSTTETAPALGDLIWPSLLLSGALTLALIVALIAPFIMGTPPLSPEVLVAIVMILGVAVLMNMLFLMAAAYDRMGLASNDQALGLPAGTVRALIALLLILLFTIVGIYLFRSLIDSTPPIPDQAAALAQQLLTTVATLVVAVSGFYFGTASTARGAMISNEAARIARGQAEPLAITTTSPLPEAHLDQAYTVQFEATGGTAPYKWRLIPGDQMPDTFKLDSSTGALTGTPTSKGDVTFSVRVTDHANANDIDDFELTVTDSAPPPATPPATGSGV